MAPADSWLQPHEKSCGSVDGIVTVQACVNRTICPCQSFDAAIAAEEITRLFEPTDAIRALSNSDPVEVMIFGSAIFFPIFDSARVYNCRIS